MAESYQVDPQALKPAADGINHSIEELKAIGIVENAEIGRGFDNLKLTGLQIGHPELQKVFDEFCERWAWGVRAMVQDGNQIAERLHLSAGLYHDQEEYVSGVAKDLYSAAMGRRRLQPAGLRRAHPRHPGCGWRRSDRSAARNVNCSWGGTSSGASTRR